jgi:hypothetical protein
MVAIGIVGVWIVTNGSRWEYADTHVSDFDHPWMVAIGIVGVLSRKDGWWRSELWVS